MKSPTRSRWAEALTRSQASLERAHAATHEAAIAYGKTIAGVLLTGRQEGRLFTTAEIEKAVDIACAQSADIFRNQFRGFGIPSDMIEGLARACANPFRQSFRDGLYAALPADVLAAEGSS